MDLSDPARPVPEVREPGLTSFVLHQPNRVLVGHSLDPVLSARLLEKWPQRRVRPALLREDAGQIAEVAGRTVA